MTTSQPETANNQFKVALLNARSIKNKIVNVCDTLQSKNISVCGITETWLYPEDGAITRELNDLGFNIFHTPRLHKQVGGVAILAKSWYQNSEVEIFIV